MRIFLLSLLVSFSASGWSKSIHDVVEKSIDGKEYKLTELKGKVILIVNIASQCGFTGQLEDLQKLHAKYEKKGFAVLGVPSNEFGGQTPEADQEMKEFCQKKYNVNFPLLSKGKVNGKDRRPLYKVLTANKKTSDDIGWNFVKFLVDKNGEVVERWSSMTGPLSKDITSKIDKLL
jgi:glutathione peroxidase